MCLARDPGHPLDQLSALHGQRRAPNPRPAAVSRPAAADQLPMPAQHGLRSHQQTRPARSWHPLAQQCQQQAITGLPAHTLHLPLEHLHLLAQDQHLRLQRTRILAPELDQVKDQAQAREQGGEEHDGA